MAGMFNFSGLKPEVSLPVSLATVGVVYATFSVIQPNLADVKASEPNHPDLVAGDTQALALATGICGAISLISGDITPFILGGMTAVALTWYYRHARALDPITGKLTGALSAGGVSLGESNNVVELADARSAY